MKCGIAWGNAGSTCYNLCNSKWKYNLHYLTNTICTIQQIHFTLSDKYNLHDHMNQLHSSDIDSSPTHCVPLSINWMESAEGKCMEIGGMMKAHDDRNGRWTSDCDCWLLTKDWPDWANWAGSANAPNQTGSLNLVQPSKVFRRPVLEVSTFRLYYLSPDHITDRQVQN